MLFLDETVHSDQEYHTCSYKLQQQVIADNSLLQQQRSATTTM